MDKYRRVEKEKKEEDDALVDSNEVRITQQGKVRSYISYANGLFTDKNETKVVFKAMGHAISKAVKVAEVLKHRIVGLHQITQISSVETVDVYEPLEEGLDRVEQKRFIPSISIELSLEPLDTSHSGYQPPIAAELVSPQIDEHDLPAKPKKPRSAKGDGKKEKKAKASGSAASAVAVAAASESALEEQERQESAQDTKESGGSVPQRGANSKRGGRGRGQRRGGRGESKTNGEAAVVSPGNNDEELKGEVVVSGAVAAAAPKKKSAPQKPKAPIVDDDAGKKKAADRAAETTDLTTDNNGPEQESNGGRGGRSRGGTRGGGSSSRGRGRGRGRGGRGEVERKDAMPASAVTPVSTEA